MKRHQAKRARRIRMQMTALLLLGVLIIGTATFLTHYQRSAAGSQAVTVDVVSTVLSQEAAQGEARFIANCATCHGEKAAGTNQGPPLIHDIYNPGHHSDEAFYLAAAIGTRQHHWTYGDMPAQPQVSREEVTTIIRYIREMQEANGIIYKPHNK